MMNSSTQYNSATQPCCFIFDVMGWRLILIKMSDFKTRLVEEQAQLEEKLNKLNDFNQSEKVKEIDPVQKDLLLVQAGAMYTYNECLKARIARL